MNQQEQDLISRLNEYVSVINAEQRVLKKKQDEKLRLQLIEWKTSPFEIELLFLNPCYNGLRYDIFEMEGIDNADMLFEQYRKIGHSIKLRKLVLHCKGKKVKAVNFKY